MIAEADTYQKYVLPKLIEAGWHNDPHSLTEQKTFSDGLIVATPKRSKHALHGRPYFPILRRPDE